MKIRRLAQLRSSGNSSAYKGIFTPDLFQIHGKFGALMMFIYQTTIRKLTSCRAYTKTRIMLNFDTTLGQLCVCVCFLVLSLSKLARCSK